MKTSFFLFLLVLSLATSAQNVSGFYTGTLFNDSTKMLQKYELALSDYRGKIDGYSYVTFVKNDTFYYGIRKVKAKIIGDSLIVQDDKMISNNFPEPPAKGVGRTITIPLRGQDSLVLVSGSWKTNQTKKYYSVPGAIDLNRSSDSSKSPLIAHLRELNLIETPVYYQNMASQPLAVADTKKDKKAEKVNTKTAASTSTPTASESETTASRGKQKNNENTATTTTAKSKDTETAGTTAAVTKKRGRDAESKSSVTGTNDPVSGTTTAATNSKGDQGSGATAAADKKKTGSGEPDGSTQKVKQPGAEETSTASTSKKMDSNGSNARKDEIKKEAETVTAAKKDVKPEVVTPPTVLPYAQRQNRIIQTIEVSSDSLILAFYDNGVVDGDSVSVYLNNETVVTNMRLNTVANKKIIPIREGQDEQLLLVAENLGRIPPNTGLITIRDGENYFQVNFSADMLNNATIVLRRKKK